MNQGLFAKASGEGASSAMPALSSSWVEHRNDLVTDLNLFLPPSGFATFGAPAAYLHDKHDIFEESISI
ncbi:hypothetical protein D8674_024608 [Pyrus ussuriensis x Pyrus communis]|uniref:Uncharacterized protein n=1 Tax=Pyrus ussuriensis x Pyrus communis TaxID=2448454 RepID=A0A5N5H3E0_9ROSA|nr:hypothetical protein D8674_024608 [Pyrus ussuriensis x Pyrus communis]